MADRAPKYRQEIQQVSHRLVLMLGCSRKTNSSINFLKILHKVLEGSEG